MRVRADISIELSVQNFAEAASHETALEQIFRRIQAQYPAARFSYRNLREVSKTSRERITRPTGSLNDYVEREA